MYALCRNGEYRTDGQLDKTTALLQTKKYITERELEQKPRHKRDKLSVLREKRRQQCITTLNDSNANPQNSQYWPLLGSARLLPVIGLDFFTMPIDRLIVSVGP